MAKVTLRPEIAGISGKVGNMIFKTFKVIYVKQG